jgi:pyruvate dehydrogenase E1 component beta subunit
LIDEFGPERVRDTPISEEAIVAFGMGAAVVGMRPVVELQFATFVALTMDPLVNQAAKLHYMFGGQGRVPLVVRTRFGAGSAMAAQHEESIESWFVHTPGIKVVMPSTPYDAKGLLKTAIRDDNPVLFLEHGFVYQLKGPVPEEEYTIPLGVADVKRPGKDVTVVATALMVHKSLAAADRLSREEGVECEVIDPRTLKPLDMDTILQSVKKTGRLVVVHEANRTLGIGAEIAARVQEEAFDYLDAPVVRVGAPDIPMPFSWKLLQAAIPQEADVVRAVRQVLGREVAGAVR